MYPSAISPFAPSSLLSSLLQRSFRLRRLKETELRSGRPSSLKLLRLNRLLLALNTRLSAVVRDLRPLALTPLPATVALRPRSRAVAA